MLIIILKDSIEKRMEMTTENKVQLTFTRRILEVSYE